MLPDYEQNILEVEDVVKSFPSPEGKGAVVKALDGVSFSVKKGGITALVGPDGAGKTTALRIIAGLMTFEKGRGNILGEELIVGEHFTHEDIGYMPQRFGLYEDLSVRENMDLYADLKGLQKSEREARYRELLEMSSMSAFSDRFAGKLSGGMKQKLGLMCTLIKAPRILVLDEPTVGVDPLSRMELWRIIEGLAKSSGMSVLMSTSYMDEADRCDEVVFFLKGKVLQRGRPDEVKRLAEGMSYMVTPEKGVAPRVLQSSLFPLKSVVDAIPQGGEVRLVREEGDSEEQEELKRVLGNAALRPVKPELEDAFMLLLHEDKKRQMEHNDAGRDVCSELCVGTQAVSSAETVIETRGVYRYFGDFIAVNNVSFSVNKGEVFGLLGPNGAGKTTTFRMLCGLLPASRGSLKVAGVDVRKTREKARRELGYVAQKFSLYGTLTVEENLSFFAGAYGLRGKKKDEAIARVVEDFSLGNDLNQLAGALPGGKKQRLSMAVGVLHDPVILFLDEPTSGADPLARREFWQRISQLVKRGVTIIVTTHFMEEAEYCDRVIIQSDGVMLAMGTPAEIRMTGGTRHETMEAAFISIVEEGRKEKKEEKGDEVL